MGIQDDSLTDIIIKAWQGRVSILVGAILGLVIAFVLLSTLTPQYEARMIIAPLGQASQETSMAVLSTSPASSREISVSSQLPRDYITFQQKFRETSVATILFRYDGIVHEIEKDSLWRWGVDVIATGEELSLYLRNNITIRQLGATASQIVTYRHPDAAFARKLLQHLHKITDELIRNETALETEARVTYLQKALRDAYNPEHRKALTDLLLLEERQKMLITMDHPYAADVLEPPAVTAKPVWPQPSVVVPLCVMIGAVFGFFAFLIRQRPSV